jgi:hypothetical protein
MTRERRPGRVTNSLQAGANTASGFGNFFVGGAGNAFFEINQPGSNKDRVCMRIDKAGQHHVPGTIHFFYSLAISLQPGITQGISGRTDRDDFSAETQDGAILDNAEIA